MGLLADAKRAVREGDGDATPARRDRKPTRAAPSSPRAATVDVAGTTVTVEAPDTEQPDSEGNWLTANQSKWGLPRGFDAVESRQIVQTAAMQSITNGIVDQLLGGDLAFETVEDPPPGTEDLRDLMRDVLTGPHLGDEDLDDLITAAVEDMLGPGNAYWQLLGATDSDLPVVSLTTLDALTVRHNVDENGVPQDPPYWQSTEAFAGSGISEISDTEPVPLQASDLAVMHYPKGNRSYRRYPVSAAWQVREWLEILADSTVHHKRFYSDNEIPPGLLQVIGANSATIEEIEAKLKESRGDPRSAPVVATEGGANWLDLGGTSINLDVISEQQWFFELCLGSLGLGKAEVGMIEDVNRSNGEIEATRVYKRVGGPFSKQFSNAMVHICQQFDAYEGQFTPTLTFTDPREAAAREERLRTMYAAGGLTLREYVRRRGDEDLAADDDRYVAEVDGTTVDYGAHPRWVAERLLSAAGAGRDPEPAGEPDADEEDETEQVAFATGAGPGDNGAT